MTGQPLQTDLLDLKGRVALITGAGQGVGRSIALHLARHNAGGIVVNDYVEERARQVADEISALGVRALPWRADITDFAAVQEMFGAARERLGPVDVLVNNAGNSGAADVYALREIPFWEQDPTHWAPWISVNFYGVLHCCRAAVPDMMARNQGRIINIISDAARVGQVTLEVYAGAKAAVGGFTRSIARTLGKHQVTANCISLAAISTPTLARRLDDPVQRRKILSQYVIRRLGEPDDVAHMALFLASDASGWITGQTYPVNGGYSFTT